MAVSTEYWDTLVREFSRSEIILDSNLLLLLLIGGFDLTLLTKFKRVSEFVEEDFRALAFLVSTSRKLHTTAHVLTEVSNLANSLPEEIKREWFSHFAKAISIFEEQVVSAQSICDKPEFRMFGITDTVLGSLDTRLLFISTDGRLCSHLQKMGRKAFNFNHLREYWLLQ